MSFFEAINQFDTRLLLGVNGTHSPYFDAFFAFFTSKESWYPFYLVLLAVVFIKYRKNGWWVSLALILTIVLSDQLSGLVKDLVERLRPSHQPALEGMLNLPVGKGGLYGFVSSHAANSFALAVMAGALSKSRRIWIAMLLWALLTSYSRVYAGVHYPFDVLFGALLGTLISWGVFRLLMLFDEYLLRKQISMAGRWKAKHKNPLLLSLVIIVLTLFIVARLVGRYDL